MNIYAVEITSGRRKGDRFVFCDEREARELYHDLRRAGINAALWEL